MKVYHYAAVEDLGLRSRLDCVVVWSHGLAFEDTIISALITEGIQPLAFFRRAPRSLRKSIKAIYSEDYAPLHHLRSKLRYLRTLPTEHLVILVRNDEPLNKVSGEGSFRHLSSTKLDDIKWRLRSQFNPRNDTGITHDHVIHATDSEAQAHSIMRRLGHGRIYDYFRRSDPRVPPPWVQGWQSSSLIWADVSRIQINECRGTRWKYYFQPLEIKQSVHYRALLGEWQGYEAYMTTFRGTAIKAYHSPARFNELKERLSTNIAVLEETPIIVRRTQDQGYLVLDGAHRASVAAKLGAKSVPVLEVQ